jgi:hypothetical protein
MWVMSLSNFQKAGKNELKNAIYTLAQYEFRSDVDSALDLKRETLIK